MPEAQRYILIKNLFINPSVLLQHVIVIITAYHQHPVYPVLHEQIKGSIAEIIFPELRYIVYHCHGA